MTQFLTILITALVLFCGPAAAQDTRETNYSAALSAAEEHYSAALEEARTTYNAMLDAARSEYSAARKAAIMQFRATDYDTYLKWLDAKELGDYDLQFNIQETGAAAEFAVAVQTAYEVEEKANAAAYRAYKAASANTYDVYEQEKEVTYDAYEKAQ